MGYDIRTQIGLIWACADQGNIDQHLADEIVKSLRWLLSLLEDNALVVPSDAFGVEPTEPGPVPRQTKPKRGRAK